LLCASCSCIRSGVFVWFLHLQHEPAVSLGFPAASRNSASAYYLRFSHCRVLLIFLARFMSGIGLLCTPPVPTTSLISLRFQNRLPPDTDLLVVCRSSLVAASDSCAPCHSVASLSAGRCPGLAFAHSTHSFFDFLLLISTARLWTTRGLKHRDVSCQCTTVFGFPLAVFVPGFVPSGK
jgi:hypothetical protein